MDKKIFSIAIDGPSGSGKSTLAKKISQELQVAYLDTGAMYRAVGLYCFENNIDIKDNVKVIEMLPNINVEIDWGVNGQITFLNGKDVSTEIRREEIGQRASQVAENKVVREKLVAAQRKFSLSNSIVMDGRDIGTQVLPDATLKFYVDASSEVRADRRCSELKAKGEDANYDEVLKEIIIRDERDKNREVGPLTQAVDAIFVDTSNMALKEVLEKTLEIIKNKIK